MRKGKQKQAKEKCVTRKSRRYEKLDVITIPVWLRKQREIRDSHGSEYVC
jgi:hypothetical protein